MTTTYAQVSDWQSYTELTINTPTDQLATVIDLAERDVDRLMPKIDDLTDLIQGLSFSNVTGGSWIASLVWGISAYTSPAIPYDVTGWELLCLLDQMVDAYGRCMPSGSWIEPSGTYNDQYYAFGPAPGTPIVIEATAMLGSCRLPLLTLDTTELDGEITVAQMVGGGLKVDPNQLSFSDQEALRRATCAQAEYRDQMGPEFFAHPQFKMVSGPEFNTQGRRPRIGPRVLDELASTDLVQRGARAVMSTRANQAMAYMPIGGLGIPDDWRAI